MKAFKGGWEMLRKIGAIVAGIVVVGLVVMTLQQVGSWLHPLPPGLDPMNPEQAEAFATYLESMPPLGWAIAFGSELLGALLGALTAGWIGREAFRGTSAAIVGLALLGSIVNWTSFSHPLWFIVGQLAGYPLALVAAWALLKKRPPTEAEGRSS